MAKGGNFLLNVGPNADGELPAEAVSRMQEIGQWLTVNGEAIYGTRAVAPYKEGRVCLTKKGNAIYLIYLAEENREAPLSEIAVSSLRKVQSVRMLGGQAVIRWKIDPTRGLVMQVPQSIQKSPPCKHAWAFQVIPEG